MKIYSGLEHIPSARIVLWNRGKRADMSPEDKRLAHLMDTRNIRGRHKCLTCLFTLYLHYLSQKNIPNNFPIKTLR